MYSLAQVATRFATSSQVATSLLALVPKYLLRVSIIKTFLRTVSFSSPDSVTTPDELLVFVNTNYSKKFTDPAKALVFAAQKGIAFPNYSVGE